ncbi:MAG: hypothetical protein Q8K60_04595 [Parachlamydiaceae bacterium]|nr:hypothetical protein [Parachlamydiaceae bacterium]
MKINNYQLKNQEYKVFSENFNVHDKPNSSYSKTKAIGLTVFSSIIGGVIGGTIGVGITVLTGGLGFGAIALGVASGAALGGSSGAITNLFFFKLMNKKIEIKEDALSSKVDVILNQINHFDKTEKTQIASGLSKEINENEKERFDIFEDDLKENLGIKKEIEEDTQFYGDEAEVNKENDLSNLFLNQISKNERLKFLGTIMKQSLQQLSFLDANQKSKMLFNYENYTSSNIISLDLKLLSPIAKEMNAIDKDKLAILKDYILFLKSVFPESSGTEVNHVKNQYAIALKDVLFGKSPDPQTDSKYVELSSLIIENADKIIEKIKV